MQFGSRLLIAAAVSALSACGPVAPEGDRASNQPDVSLRNLSEVDGLARNKGTYRIEGDPIPTPSDPSSRYYLLRKRQEIGGNITAIVKQQRGERAAYARVELDCASRQFHILGVGGRRAEAETDIAYDGPLRSTEGLPLRQELSAFVCR